MIVDFCSSALESLKARQQGAGKKGLIVVGDDRVYLCLLICVWPLHPPRMQLLGGLEICLTCSFLNSLCLEPYLAHNKCSRNTCCLKESVLRVDLGVTLLKHTLDNPKHQFSHP